MQAEELLRQPLAREQEAKKFLVSPGAVIAPKVRKPAPALRIFVNLFRCICMILQPGGGKMNFYLLEVPQSTVLLHENRGFE